jgi:hypothetical protein
LGPLEGTICSGAAGRNPLQGAPGLDSEQGPTARCLLDLSTLRGQFIGLLDGSAIGERLEGTPSRGLPGGYLLKGNPGGDPLEGTSWVILLDGSPWRVPRSGSHSEYPLRPPAWDTL